MAKKLPRRVQSMAKRAGKTAENAANLDLLGGDEAAEDAKVAPFAYAGAWIGGIIALMVIIIAVRVVFAIPLPSTGDAEFAPAGALSRVTPAYAGLATPFGNGGVTSAPRSTFPAARQEAPIILQVACPDGTIQIAVGDRVADTVCITGVLVGDAPSETMTGVPVVEPNVILITVEGDRANVGGTDVPNGLQCEEDEVIGFIGIPDTLVCLHIDSFLP